MAHTVGQALAAQAVSCANAGSPLYGTLLEGLGVDHAAGGITAELLEGVSDRPVHDAIPLRYLATAHRLALSGAAPSLAAQYPSCGGRWSAADDLTAAFLGTVAGNRNEFVAGLRRNVQTNEVGRAAVLASGFAWIGARYGLPTDQLEVGSSAGILSRWDHFAYDTGANRCGDPSSALRFDPAWWCDSTTDGRSAALPDLAAVRPVVRRRASDISPVDIITEAGRTTMASFVWPDQMARLERLRTAMQIAATSPLDLQRADAGAWLASELANGTAAGAVTVVFHSIVWQYLPTTTRDALSTALMVAGERATERNPLCWLRMEPAAATHADLRVTCWPGGETVHLADVGYHGTDIRWLAPPT